MQRYRHRTYGYRTPTNQKRREFFYNQSKLRIQLQYGYGHGTIRAVSHSYEIHSNHPILWITRNKELGTFRFENEDENENEVEKKV